MSQDSMLPEVLRRLILDEAIAAIKPSEVERAEFWEQLSTQRNYQTWLQQQGITPEEFEAWLERELKIHQFQYQRWNKTLYTYFLERKADLDRVVCSLIYLRNKELAHELYFRLAEGEQSFSEVARRYSQGESAETGGKVGPIELSKLHPKLARMFYGSPIGKLWQPIAIDQWMVIARLEASLPVQLDDAMRQFLFNELLEKWLQDQMNQRFPSR